MITFRNEEEIMVWLFAINGYASDRSDLNGSFAADYGDSLVEEFRKRIPKQEENIISDDEYNKHY